MIAIILAARDSDAAGLAGFSAIVGLLGLFLAIVWILFPFLVNSKLNALIQEQRRTNAWLKIISEGSRGTQASVKERGSHGALSPPTLPEAERRSR